MILIHFVSIDDISGEKHDGNYINNKKEGEGWWRNTTGKVREGVWKDDVLLKFVGLEVFEAQMKAKKLARLNNSLATINRITTTRSGGTTTGAGTVN